MKRLFNDHSLPRIALWLHIPLLCGIAYVFNLFNLQVIDANLTQIPAYKFTFVSVLFAVGLFQYNFFFTMAERFRKTLDEGEFNPLWKDFITKTEGLRVLVAHNQIHPQINTWREQVKSQEQQIKEHIEWNQSILKKLLVEASFRFALIFAVGLGLLVSLLLDIIALVSPISIFNPITWSQNFLFASLALFCCLFLVFVYSFDTELSARMESTLPPAATENAEDQKHDNSGGIMSDEELQSQWPGIKYAYEFVLPSYQWMIARLESADSRIQTLQTFIVTFTFGLSAVITAVTDKSELKFVSWPFITAIILALLAIVIGAYGRSLGGVMVINPNQLYKQWLHKPELAFKKDILFFAGEHFVKNTEVINKKSYITITMTVLFLAEMGLLLFWIVFEKN